MAEQVIGIIGGSGLYEIDGLAGLRTVKLDTPFGAPSDEYLVGQLEGRTLVFLPRHGRGHRFSPSEVNFRANIHGFLQLGARWILSVSAVGSMREALRPGDFVVVDQFFDRTKGRACSFFGEGIVGHVSMADPVCLDLAKVVYEAAQEQGIRAHEGGTYICIEGPQFSTRAESRVYRTWGVDVIGMTNVPEAKLAREAGLCYATIAMVTDYDCWHESEADVSVETVLETLRSNVAAARRLVAAAALRIPPHRGCGCAAAPRTAVLTAREAIDPRARERLALLLGDGVR
jgi:5'-methylthioadenosine phosphorylase